MSRHQDELVAIDAGQVTLKGTPEEVDELASAAGLYAEPLHRRLMSNRDEDSIMTGVYIGIGLLVAAGAGYLAWRYALSDEQKQKAVNATKNILADGATHARRALRDARDKVHI
ncbi:MAG TPA: hypothetical protein VM327_07855 [Candidatus Thermoplasmatota archaeon]|nr:hypothetical protein [Candidatus Thermoplasmatota archaeon]